jgi:hypothetical protein
VGQQLRRPPPDQDGEVGLEFGDLGAQGEHPAGGGAQRQHAGVVAGAALWAAAQPGAPGSLDHGWLAAKLVAQTVRGGQDQRLEAVDGGGAAGDGALAGDQQHSEALAVAVGAGDGLMGSGERLPGGADGVEGVGLAAAAGRPPRMVDLDHQLPVGVQEPREADPVAAGAFHGPQQPRPRGVGQGEVQQRLVATTGGRNCSGHADGAGWTQQRSAVGVAVGVDADDGVQLLCHHQGRPSGSEGQVGVGLG